MCWRFHFPVLLRISFRNVVFQLFLFTQWGEIQGQQPGMRTCWMRRKGLEWAFWASRAVCWQQPSPLSSVEWLLGQFTWALQGKVQWDFDTGMGWVADTHAEVGAAHRTQAVVYSGITSPRVNQTNSPENEPSDYNDSILHVSRKKGTSECWQISKVLI